MHSQKKKASKDKTARNMHIQRSALRICASLAYSGKYYDYEKLANHWLDRTFKLTGYTDMYSFTRLTLRRLDYVCSVYAYAGRVGVRLFFGSVTVNSYRSFCNQNKKQENKIQDLHLPSR